MKASMCSLSCLTEVKDAPRSDWPCRIENQISTWLSQDGRVGVKWNWTFGCRLSQRSLLGCEPPLHAAPLRNGEVACNALDLGIVETIGRELIVRRKQLEYRRTLEDKIRFVAGLGRRD